MWTHYSNIAAAALATCVATYPVQAGESRLPCTVGLGAGLPCRRLSAGCRFQTEIPAVCRATCLLCAMSEQHLRQSTLHSCRSPRMERAAVQSTWHWAIADYLQCTLEDILTLNCVWGHGAFVTFTIYCAVYKCTYLLTYYKLCTIDKVTRTYLLPNKLTNNMQG